MKSKELKSDFKIVHLENKTLRCKILDYGAKLMSLEVKDPNGVWIDVVNGYDSNQEYLIGSPYYGALCGRYANRMNKGSFSLNGKKYQLELNHEGHHLHGGSLGIQSKKWEFDHISKTSSSLSLLSPDMEMGYPGNLRINLEFNLEGESLIIKYTGISDQDTVLNLAPHYYFNLNGKGNILNHKLQINTDDVVEVNKDAIPSGRIISIKNTALDFRIAKPIGLDMDKSNELLNSFGGYDHCFVLRKDRPIDEPVAELISENKKCKMYIYTSQPALQLYTCNWGDQSNKGKGGQIYREHSFVCLESQHYPDSPNHSNFPSTTLAKGDLYSHFTRYEFKFVDGV